ncbi:MAG: hypothetical protein FWD68_02095 [Alphaproteobacteria bacterium]|nr:hypothetical protein [Alphaproteobacteria bacterium]
MTPQAGRGGVQTNICGGKDVLPAACGSSWPFGLFRVVPGAAGQNAVKHIHVELCQPLSGLARLPAARSAPALGALDPATGVLKVDVAACGWHSADPQGGE